MLDVGITPACTIHKGLPCENNTLFLNINLPEVYFLYNPDKEKIFLQQ